MPYVHDSSPPADRAVIPFSALRKEDTAIAGGKGANLGELTRAGLPVPDGFVVTAQTYLAAMDAAGVRSKLQSLALELDTEDPAQLASMSEELRRIVHHAGIPHGLRDTILRAHEKLGAARVAVRSSATAEDTAGTSFAGMNETFTNVTGSDL
jgi:pyruvate,water dikinase